MTEHAAQNQEVSALYDKNRDESKSWSYYKLFSSKIFEIF